MATGSRGTSSDGPLRLVVRRRWRRRPRRSSLLLARVVAAHQPLQLGELADHAADQIGLGQASPPARQSSASAPTSGAISRASAAMRSMRSSCVPSFSWKTICLQLRHARSSSADVAVLIAEEVARRQPRADHPLVAGDDGLAAVGALRDWPLMMNRLASSPAWLAQRRSISDASRIEVRITSGGTVEELLVEVAHQHDRPFGQARALSSSRPSSSTRVEALRAGQRLRGSRMMRAALIAVEDDFGFVQASGDNPRTPHLERLRRHEAVARGHLAALDAVDLERHDLAVRTGRGCACSGRTQRKRVRSPQRIDFGQGKTAHDLGTISATTSVGRHGPAFRSSRHSRRPSCRRASRPARCGSAPPI